MGFDNSRYTFDPRSDYSGVVMQQGRVQLDSDWNEWLAELVRRMQAGTLDILGRAVYPATTPHAFEITASSPGGKNTLLIGPGRMYVDGLLAENHGERAAARWDPALGEMSDAPQPPIASATTGAIDYTLQPYMPRDTPLPKGNGPFLMYLDVWVRPVDYINDPDLIDAAVGIDSTGRLQTVWQVRLLDLAHSPGATCDSPIDNWPPAPSAGLLTTDTTPTAPSGPCCLTSGAAYTGLENQFYRVEIHQEGIPEGSAVPPASLAAGTFKWSRDNGSVITSVTGIANVTNSAGNSASQLTVLSLGRDQVLGFTPGNWIEILDDATEFHQTHGELHQIDTIDVAAKTITLATTLGAGFLAGNPDRSLHTRIRRWDQSGKVYEQDGTTVWWDIDVQGSADIPVPPSGTSLILENGITVGFDLSSATGGFITGDFWTFAARTSTGKVEKLDKVAPRGIHHHYARLSIVTFPNSAHDCRTGWPSTGKGECGCCLTVTVGDGVNTFGKYTSINDAINALPADGGGEVCILPGRYFENVSIEGRRDVVLRGCGWQTRIASAALKPAPAPAAGGAAPDTRKVFLVFFDCDTHNITPKGQQVITLAAQQYKADGSVRLQVTGYTDLSSSAGYNQQLSERRADAVANALELLGVAPSDMVVTGRGMNDPRVPTAPGVSETQNRRVENVFPAGDGGAKTDSPPFAAVITISQSQHVKLLGFAVEAVRDEVGVLIDGTGTLSVPPPHRGGGEANVPRAKVYEEDTIDVTVADLVITASTVPAILADSVTLLQVVRNRIAMEDIPSRWPAVWVSGTEIRIVHNWLGIQSRNRDLEWLPATVQRDIASELYSSRTGSNPGGIQIAGTSVGAPTRDVFVSENEIDSAGRNGITLGSLAILDSEGNDTGTIAGTTVEVPGPCDTTITLQIPTTNPGQPGSRIVAAGQLVDIQISRIRIGNTGACGIGPVGFFDRKAGPEIVAIQNLSITANTISDTLLAEATGMRSGAFGAICIPFVGDLVIRDNVITDFGFRPGDPVCGIFVFYGQNIDISGNQVLETRHWKLSTQEEVSPAGLRGGIVVHTATPPSFTTVGSLYDNADNLASAYAAPSFVPGVPALRVVQNVVRVAAGDALEAAGYGPFSIVNNHFSTAGAVPGGGVSTLGQTVFILNLGMSIDFAALAKFSNFARDQPTPASFQAGGSRITSNGAVTFTENMCQLVGAALGMGTRDNVVAADLVVEGRIITRRRVFSSVMIVSHDDLIFGNNQCWMDAIARPVTAHFDAFLVAGLVQVTSNRFQEVPGSVWASGFTHGLLNITGQNISSHCLFATGLLKPALLTENLSLTHEACDEVAHALKLKFTDSFTERSSGFSPTRQS